MDEMNVHQFWGVSPFLDLLAASAAACSSKARDGAAPRQAGPLSFLQICPYDCRHTLATISSHIADPKIPGTQLSEHQDLRQAAPDAVPDATAKQHTMQHLAQQEPQQRQQLHLYVYEAEPEVLARHMLLLSVLFDSTLTVRQRAEMFLELHGNVMLRQNTAHYLVDLSRHLEAAVSQLSVSPSPAAAVAQLPKPSGNGQCKPQQQQPQQQQQQQQALGVLAVFNLSLLRYQERDALLETFQRYRSKAAFNMSKAWDDRCRKWYADRYDFRTNVTDWDYHMRLGPRGTPFMDPAQGSIVHYYHFRHWRLNGIAYELRDSSYCATNSSLLSTAYGRSKEYKDRQLRDIGRSVAAFSYWGDILNGPYHAFGTVATDPGLFKVVNKQFAHTAVDVAEHNVLGFINQLQSSCSGDMCTAASATHMSSNHSSSDAAAEVSHRANAARGPTSMEHIAAVSNAQHAVDGADYNAKPLQQAQQQEQQHRQVQHQQQEQDVQGLDQAVDDGQAVKLAAKQSAAHLEQPNKGQQQQQQQRDREAERLAALEAAITAASIQLVVSSVKVFLVSGDIKRSLTGKAKFAGLFTATTVGHRHVHLLSPEYGVANVINQPMGVVFVESGQNLVQLNGEQVAEFEKHVVELAGEAGFNRHSAFSGSKSGSSCSSSKGSAKNQQQQEAAGAWPLPAGHFALGLVATGQKDAQ